MRKIITALQVSLDGLIEGPEGEVDWIGSWEDSFGLTQEADTCVLGGGMYRGYEEYWLGILEDPEAVQPLTGQLPSAGEVEYARFAARTPHVVLSRTLTTANLPTTRFAREISEIRALKAEPGKHIYAVGGATLVSSLMNEGLVDEVRLTVHPLVLGRGKPLFKDVREQHSLELHKSESLAGGRVGLVYRFPWDRGTRPRPRSRRAGAGRGRAS